jgi:hypothetical protein
MDWPWAAPIEDRQTQGKPPQLPSLFSLTVAKTPNYT